MKKLHLKIAVCALMAPAITFGIGSAIADDTPHTATDRELEQRAGQDQQKRTMPMQTQKEKGMATADRAQEQRMAADRAKQHLAVHGTYLSSQPANSFRADELIGSDLKSRTDNETIGSISDVLIDADGQIVAVMVEVGGFLGIGKKEVAISWDSIEHRLNEKGDGYHHTASSTKDALKDAPEYEHKASKY
jgi:sporulation protein YlmC with PRC-barrel domain